jgi:hypothetical protein
VPIVADTVRLEFEYRSSGAASAMNVIHARSIGGNFDEATMLELRNEWALQMKEVINANWIIDGTTRCLDLSVDPPDEIFADSDDAFGLVAGTALPPACTAVISLSAGTSRRRRGRIYLPGMTESKYSDDGQALAGFAGDVIVQAGECFTNWATNSGWVAAVYSRADGVSRGVSTLTVDGNLDTQRRRQGRLAT